jgi:hypothetical protein
LIGGTGATLYACRLGLEKAFPGSMESGLREAEAGAVILASGSAHYCRWGSIRGLGPCRFHRLEAWERCTPASPLMISSSYRLVEC